MAIVGAAGSMGRATIKCLSNDGENRKLTLVDLLGKTDSLKEIVSPLKGDINISADLKVIQKADIVVCVTNASKAIITADLLAKDVVVIDDAQPENITIDVIRKRPDVTVIKCLAKVPGLHNPFDFGLFDSKESPAKQEITFTCLAETILLAASKHKGHFTIGDPTDSQIRYLKELADKFQVGIAPFHSFPEIGEVNIIE